MEQSTDKTFQLQAITSSIAQVRPEMCMELFWELGQAGEEAELVVKLVLLVLWHPKLPPGLEVQILNCLAESLHDIKICLEWRWAQAMDSKRFVQGLMLQPFVESSEVP
ncbi:hypothetical protein TURU_063319 [Turdus rufiventris]|nr:hypothetical protein TURU_063319 [Turdus rufiventris]